MSSYDVQRRKLFPIIREAILKAYNEYGLGLDEDLAGCETMHIFKDITAEGFRRESEVAEDILGRISLIIGHYEQNGKPPLYGSLCYEVDKLKKKYIGEKK